MSFCLRSFVSIRFAWPWASPGVAHAQGKAAWYGIGRLCSCCGWVACFYRVLFLPLSRGCRESTVHTRSLLAAVRIVQNQASIEAPPKNTGRAISIDRAFVSCNLKSNMDNAGRSCQLCFVKVAVFCFQGSPCPEPWAASRF